MGSNGAICSSIDGSGSSYPIGECDNASRVIKHVVLLGYKYSHYNLVDMRIYDIKIAASPKWFAQANSMGYSRPSKSVM